MVIVQSLKKSMDETGLTKWWEKTVFLQKPGSITTSWIELLHSKGGNIVQTEVQQTRGGVVMS